MTNETNPWNDVRSSSVNDRDAASAPRTDADAADGRMPGQQAQDRPGHGQIELPAISRSDAPGAPERDAAAGAAEASTPRPAPATPAAPVDPTNLPPRPDADAARREGTPNHNLAVAAVILGALSILLSAVPVIGLVLAVAAIWCAVRATRGTASTGMSTAGKVLGIAGTIISVLISLLYIAALLFAVDVVRGSYEYLSPEPLDALGDSETPALEPDRDLDEDERAAWDAVAARFDAIDPNDPALQGEVTEHLAGMLLDDGTQDLAPYGADAEAYATWMLVDLTYENTGIFVSGDTPASSTSSTEARSTSSSPGPPPSTMRPTIPPTSIFPKTKRPSSCRRSSTAASPAAPRPPIPRSSSSSSASTARGP